MCNPLRPEMSIHSSSVCRPRAFTLIEVLVVVAIIALLIAVLLPSLHEARRQARVSACAANVRTCGHGILYYAQANRDHYPDAGKWAEHARDYIQKLSVGQVIDGNRAEIFVKFYDCPDDKFKAHSGDDANQTIQGMQTMYYVSYAINANLCFPLRDPSAAARGENFDLIVPENNRPAKHRKTTQDDRPFDLVMLTDGGDDDVREKERVKWDWDDDEDNTFQADVGGYSPVLEVHHKTGNNFLFADNHIEYKKVLKREGPQEELGVPVFPRHWIPIRVYTPTAP